MSCVEGDIVLVGGGHTHVQVMTAFGSQPEPGMRLVLVSDALMSPYSGMLPGHIAGLYRRDEMQIDLAGLAAATGTTLIHARVIGLDRARKLILCEGREPVPYRLASFNVGITPDLASIEGAQMHGVPVKPISSFLERCDGWLAATARDESPRTIAIVGNGAAGVELAFALAARLRRRGAEGAAASCNIVLIGSGAVVAKLNPRMRRLVERALDRHAITRRDGVRVVAITPDSVLAANGERIAADATLISTRARAPLWLEATGLPLTQDGSIATSAALEVADAPGIFAVGDCASVIGSPREKAGVFAVRQGPALAENLRLAWRGLALREHHPQDDYLVLLSTGDRRGIGGRGDWLAFEGRWVWWLKDWIDRRFMARFRPGDRR